MNLEALITPRTDMGGYKEIIGSAYEGFLQG